MSSLYLPLGLLATFSAVLLVGLAVDAVLADRRRTLQLLRDQVGEVGTNLRQQELARPFMDRVLVPFVSALGTAARLVTPVGMRDRIARKIVLAGSPPGWDAEKIAAFKVFGAFGGAGLGGFFGLTLGVAPNWAAAAAVFGGLFGYLLPGAFIGQAAIHRQEAIRRALPDTMDLLTISVEAGLGFDAALAHVRKNVPGALSDEIGRMLQEMQLGVSRVDAFRHLADRTDVEELRGFILAMIQADVFGISVAKVLRAQARELRLKRKARAEEQAMKVPVKLLFPMIFGILPAMFVAIVGPGIIRIAQTFFGIGN